MSASDGKSDRLKVARVKTETAAILASWPEEDRAGLPFLDLLTHQPGKKRKNAPEPDPLLEQMVNEWCKGKTHKEKKVFFSSVKVNSDWDQTKNVKRLVTMLQTDSILAFLIGNLSLDPDVVRRASYRVEHSNGICVDDINDRYVKLSQRMAVFKGPSKEKYQEFLFAQEKLRSNVMVHMQKYNESLKRIKRDFKMETYSKPLPYFKWLDQMEQDYIDESEAEEDPPEFTCPLHTLTGLSCWGLAVLVELAFDILRLGSIQEVKKQIGFYYRVQFAYY